MSEEPSGAEIIAEAIQEAKKQITARQAPRAKSTVARVLEGLEALREASQGAFNFAVTGLNPHRLTATTNLLGPESTIRIRGSGISLGRDSPLGDMTDETLLADLAKKAVKQGMIP